jgi:hypothetical protein
MDLIRWLLASRNYGGASMKNKIKLWLRRWTLRTLRKLVDLADDRLHSAEMRFRDEQSARVPVDLPVESAVAARPQRPTVSCPYPFPEDELLRHRVSRRPARRGEPQRPAKSPRRRITAAEFDMRFSL